jgi:hypothetical protein
MATISSPHSRNESPANPGGDTVEFAPVPGETDEAGWDNARPQARRHPTRESVVEPFRFEAADLVELFETTDARKPQWHRGRARQLRKEAALHPVAAVSDAYCRLAARHDATARVLEPADAPQSTTVRGHAASVVRRAPSQRGLAPQM